MKKNYAFLFGTISIIFILFVKVYYMPNQFDNLREKHRHFLRNSPFKETKQLSKKERKSMGIPPNPYNERQWELTMNPNLGLPTPEKAFKLQKELRASRQYRPNAVPGQTPEMAWTERGPNNLGGRTRGLVFDPNDATRETVLAGGVSGGLWRNTKISDKANSWELLDIPENLAISVIAYDPNDTNTIYVGTGESYTFGTVVGNGVWKSTNNGQTWTHVFGGATGVTTSTGSGQVEVHGQFYVNDLVIRNNNGNSEVYVGIGSNYSKDILTSTSLGINQYGLFKSTNDGGNWLKIDIKTEPNYNDRFEPNDIEIDDNGNIWIGTTRNVYGLGGGAILKSNDGNTFQAMHAITNGARTEIEITQNKIYVLAEIKNSDPPVSILRTEDGFSTSPTQLPLPNDADDGIPANDFTRGQAFYDLMIEADPNNEDVVYVGGIDLFKSTNSGDSWTQISKWSNNNNLNDLNVSLVHADQHAMAFADSDRLIFGHDGGVSYSDDGGNTFGDRIKNYRTAQFYTLGVAPTDAFPGYDVFLAGSQDNGTHYLKDEVGDLSSSTEIKGGDGAYSFFSSDPNKVYLVGNYVYNRNISLYNFSTRTWTKINKEGGSNGDFINPQALDSNLDILYSNYTPPYSSNYRIRRYANLLNSPNTVDNKTILTNALLNASPTAFTVSPHTTNSSLLLAGLENGRLLKIENAETDNPVWNDISGQEFVGSISDVEFGLLDQEIYVTFYNYGINNNIFYTSDGGVSWIGKEGDFPDIPVRSILKNPLNQEEVIIGTDLGVWFTDNFSDASPNWQQAYNGMSNVKVTDIDLKDDNMAFAATYGRGVFSGLFTAESLSVEKTLNKNKSFITRNSVGEYHLHFGGNAPQIDYAIFNLMGQQIQSHTKVDTTNSETISLDNYGLSSGVYLVQIRYENIFETLKWQVR
jgi:hypothetical protein